MHRQTANAGLATGASTNKALDSPAKTLQAGLLQPIGPRAVSVGNSACRVFAHFVDSKILVLDDDHFPAAFDYPLRLRGGVRAGGDKGDSNGLNACGQTKRPDSQEAEQFPVAAAK